MHYVSKAAPGAAVPAFVWAMISVAVSAFAFPVRVAAAPFRVVGYAAGWGADIQAIQYKKLTHVLWSFAAPNDDGSITGFDGAKLTQLAAAAHANQVKVFLAIGGGGNGDKGWQTCTATDAGRQALVKACMAAVHAYALDGIDFDWEYPDGAQVAGYNAAVKALAAALHAEGKEISAAVTKTDWPHSFPTRELYDPAQGPGFDFLNIMVYDDPPPHSTLKAAQQGLDAWIKTKGLAKERCVLGCPFYGAAGKYKDIVARDPAAAWVDKEGEEDYNSIPTLKKKTNLALDQAGGIMFWELSQDAVGSLSLLSAVHDVIVARGTTVILVPGAESPFSKRSQTFRASWAGTVAFAGPSMGIFDLRGRAAGAVRSLRPVPVSDAKSRASRPLPKQIVPTPAARAAGGG